MRWFHPIGGPVLLLPRSIVRRWRGQKPDSGFTPAYEAVLAGLGDAPWVGLDIGGLALTDAFPIGLHEADGRVRLVLRRNAATDSLAEAVGSGMAVGEAVRRIPWPGGEGVLFDAVESGDALDAGFTTPLDVTLPEGPLEVGVADVAEGPLELTVLELRAAG